MVYKIEYFIDVVIRVVKSVRVFEMKISFCYKLVFLLCIKFVCSFILFYNFKFLLCDVRIGVLWI